VVAGIVLFWLDDEMVFVEGVRGDLAYERELDELGTRGDM
jgi:hypothetical protein